MEEKKDWKDRLRDFPFIRMYLLKKFKANNPREQGMADILTLVKDKEFYDLIDFIQQELDKAREEGSKHMQGWECPKCGSVYSPLTFECNGCKNSGIRVRTSDRTTDYDNSSNLN